MRREEAGLYGKAIHYLTKAGEQAVTRFANAESVAFFSRALALIPEADESRRYALLLARERVHHLLGHREQQRLDLQALRSMVEVTGEEARKAEVALEHTVYLEVISDYPQAQEEGCRAIELADGDPRARPVLGEAHHLLEETACSIEDPGLRSSYLENVAAHRELSSLYTAE